MTRDVYKRQNYAYEAGELESYRASRAANVECRKAIEAAISSNYGDNRLDADAAVKSVLEPVSYTHLDVYKRQDPYPREDEAIFD